MDAIERTRLWPVYVSIGAAVLLALIGGVLAVRMLGDVAEAGVVQTSVLPRVGDPVRTSFGAISVGYTLTLASPSAHGLHLNAAKRRALEVDVTLTNLGDDTVAYSPAQFRLRTGALALPPLRATIDAGTLQPHASIQGLLTFGIPSGRRRLLLAFRDPRRPQPLLVDLGRAGRAAPDPHHHH